MSLASGHFLNGTMLAMHPAHALYKGPSRLIEHLIQQSVRQLASRAASTSCCTPSPASSLEQLVAGAQRLQADTTYPGITGSRIAQVQRLDILSSRPDLPLEG